MRKRRDNDKRWRRNNSKKRGVRKVTIREGEEEEGKEKATGGRKAAERGCNQTETETIGQKHSGGKKQRTGEETDTIKH